MGTKRFWPKIVLKKNKKKIDPYILLAWLCLKVNLKMLKTPSLVNFVFGNILQGKCFATDKPTLVF